MSTASTPPLAERIVDLVERRPGLTDRELTDLLFTPATHPSQVNQACRHLPGRRRLSRLQREDGRLGNYLTEEGAPIAVPSTHLDEPLSGGIARDGLSEDEVKHHLRVWLEGDGWDVAIASGKFRGVDLLAKRQGRVWIIEAKGCGSRQPMRVNYFLAVLGDTLQRMNDPAARYSIAVPDMAQFRGLWQRLPRFAKDRTRITALFVSESGLIEEVI